MTILDGKKIAQQIRSELRNEIVQIIQKEKRVPCLAIVMVGHNPASETYVANKMKACTEVGILALQIVFEETISEQDLLREIHRLNANDAIDGFIVQLPLPAHISEARITAAIDYRKDVDGLTPENVGRTILGQPSIISATPRGICELLAHYQIDTDGKHVVIIGRSNIVGKPLANVLIQKQIGGNATVTLCHSHTQNLREICLSADIIIVATGHPHLLTADMVRDGVTVVDVGINRIEDPSCAKGYRLVGDVDYAEVSAKAAFITPVPGGVGPMTIAALLQNTLQAFHNHTH